MFENVINYIYGWLEIHAVHDITLISRRHPKSGARAADHYARVLVLVSCQKRRAFERPYLSSGTP